jgi:hypothetical protein
MGTHPRDRQPNEQESMPSDTKRPKKTEPDYQSDCQKEVGHEDQNKSRPDTC